MSRLARFLLVALATAAASALAPRAARAQFALDAELRRAIQTYQAGRFEAAAGELGRLANGATLTVPDRAVALLYRGFALFRIKRDAESARALEAAVVLDPTLRPDPVTNSTELLDAWRRARLRIPLITSFDISTTEFVPGLDSGARITYAFEVDKAERRYTAQMRFLLIRTGSADTVVAWRGDEGQVVRWDGVVRDAPISAGTWEMILEARAPGSEAAGYSRKRAEVEVVSATGDRRLPMPVSPRMLPETLTVSATDDEARTRRITRGLWMLGAGAILATYANINYKSAITDSPKGSSERTVVAATYFGGVGLLGFGSWYTLSGWRGNYETPIRFPSTENVRRNREARLQYSADSARVTDHNRALSSGRLVRLRFIEGAR